MKIKLKKEIQLIILSLIPLFYLLMSWRKLSNKIPIHFNLKGEINGYTDKVGLFYAVVVISVLVYLMMQILPKIDPKKQIQHMGNKYYYIKFLIIAFVSSLLVFIIYLGLNPKTNPNIIMLILAVFLILIGNYFQTIKQNYFLGIRTPWTLHSEEVWRKTHRITGKVFMVLGSLVFVSYFVTSKDVFYIINIISFGLMILIPVVYSYLLYKKENKIH